MSSLKLSVAFLSAILSVVGCGSVDKLGEYDEYQKTSPQDQPLVLPNDLNDSSIENYYPVPKAEDGKPAIGVSTLPPKSKLLK